MGAIVNETANFHRRDLVNALIIVAFMRGKVSTYLVVLASAIDIILGARCQ